MVVPVSTFVACSSIIFLLLVLIIRRTIQEAVAVTLARMKVGDMIYTTTTSLRMHAVCSVGVGRVVSLEGVWYQRRASDFLEQV